ncbi:inactive transglutaminase family protein [Luteimonas sp. SJ-92]|uniref:Inactive transglutaminase family protein n=1 Tax=Luteimonas salinisoli TaxID=2752307 RepID=A0A853JFK6_9GAMM|nr:inactive transglutaminase family protein [Luteimonas salinisoli]NZA27512.1 inactive transglutaminase family protein [Luteimonas salinisoli]
MRRWHLLALVLVLLTSAASLIAYKVRVLGYPLAPGAEIEGWIVEARLSFTPTGGAVKAELAIPSEPPGYVQLDENFVSRGYGLQTEERDGQRLALWTTRRPAGPQTLYYRTTVTGRDGQGEAQPVPALDEVPAYQEVEGEAVQAILDEVRGKSADIATFSSILVRLLASPAPDENVQLLLPPNAGREQRVRTAIRILAGARIPARMVQGVRLADGARNLRPEHWLEVNNGDDWIPLDPTSGARGYPADFFVWWRGADAPYALDNARNAELSFSVVRTLEPALEMVTRQAQLADSAVMAYSLSALPVHVQNVYRTLLLVPIGILLIVFLRNVVGIQTFGTFMPVLISLAFRETDLLSGAIMFTVIVALGLLVRFYLEHLKLLLVPRLAVVVIVVILLMLLVSMLSYRMQFDVGLSVALFPMVIMAMTIERISIVWEEHGPAEAIRQSMGSLVVAILSYLAMFHPRVDYFVFVFPEALLIVLAMALLLGRYTGYRLSELLRFRDFNAASRA